MVSVSSTSSCVLWTDRNVDADAERWRILVVDDNAASAEGLAAALNADGCDARYALSGVAALQAIDAWVPHVAILDISMPEHDGFATARVLRRISPTRNAGIIAFTALGGLCALERPPRRFRWLLPEGQRTRCPRGLDQPSGPGSLKVRCGLLSTSIEISWFQRVRPQKIPYLNFRVSLFQACSRRFFPIRT